MTIEAMTGSRPWLAAGWTMLHFLWVGGALGLVAAAGAGPCAGPAPRSATGSPCSASRRWPWRRRRSSRCLSRGRDRRPARGDPARPRMPARPAPSRSGMAPAPGPSVAALGAGDDPPRGRIERPRGRVGAWTAAAAGLPWLWIVGHAVDVRPAGRRAGRGRAAPATEPAPDRRRADRDRPGGSPTRSGSSARSPWASATAWSRRSCSASSAR